MIKSSATPRVGFLGVGWIGRHRLSALVESGCAEVVGLVEPSPTMLAQACAVAPRAAVRDSLESLLELEPDGIVIATPSALHAAQCVSALEGGTAVFCQKPLARNARETAEVIAAAQRADRLLDVDFSYRHTRACQAIKGLIQSGELGNIFGARFVFHNAYGPDKAWYLDRAQSGGGCVMDLGSHLVDLALWLLSDNVKQVRGRVYAGGTRVTAHTREVEDYAAAVLEMESGATVEIACSWHLHAGCDAVIEAQVFGTSGGARFQNVSGSFYDFSAERMHGTQREVLASPPDAWGGRALVSWVRRLRESRRFDTAALELVRVAEVLDEIMNLRI